MDSDPTWTSEIPNAQRDPFTFLQPQVQEKLHLAPVTDTQGPGGVLGYEQGPGSIDNQKASHLIRQY